MATSTLLIVIVAAIIISIAIGYKFKLNVGIIALAFAYIIGVFLVGLRPSALVGMWSGKLAYNMLSIMIFYGYANYNGALKIVAHNILYPFRKKPWLLLIVAFFLAAILGLAAGPAATNTLPALLFPVMLETGINPVMVLVIVTIPALCGTFAPFSGSGVLLKGFLDNMGGWYAENTDGILWTFVVAGIVISLLFFVIMFFATRAFKAPPVDMDEPAKPNKEQKQTLIVLFVVIFLLVVPGIFSTFMKGSWIAVLSSKMDIQFLGPLASVIYAFMRIAPEKVAIKEFIPWGSILTITGVALLISIATNQGAVDYLAAAISDNMSKALIPAMFTLIAGFMSCFTGGVTVVTPTLWAVVPAVCAKTGLDPIVLMTGILLGSGFTAVSPFSTGGAVTLSYCQDEEKREKLYVQQIVLAIVALIFITICSVTGITGIFSLVK